MTKEQLNIIFNDLSKINTDHYYGLDKWISMDDVAEIQLGYNTHIYPDNTLRVFFDTKNELLRYKNVKENPDGSFESTSEENYIEFAAITSINMVTKFSRKSAYKYGITV